MHTGLFLFPSDYTRSKTENKNDCRNYPRLYQLGVWKLKTKKNYFLIMAIFLISEGKFCRILIFKVSRPKSCTVVRLVDNGVPKIDSFRRRTYNYFLNSPNSEIAFRKYQFIYLTLQNQ